MRDFHLASINMYQLVEELWKPTTKAVKESLKTQRQMTLCEKETVIVKELLAEQSFYKNLL